MPSDSMPHESIGSYRVNSNKVHLLDQSDNNHLPYGPYKVAWGSGNEVFPKKEVPYNHSYRTNTTVEPHTYREVCNLQIQLHQLTRGQHS